MTIKMYRGIDKNDGSDSLFAVENGQVASSFYTGTDDAWLCPESYLRCQKMFSPLSSYADSIADAELIWEFESEA